MEGNVDERRGETVEETRAEMMMEGGRGREGEEGREMALKE